MSDEAGPDAPADPVGFEVLAAPPAPTASSPGDVVFLVAVAMLVLAPDGVALYLLLRLVPETAWGLYWTVPVMPLLLGTGAIAGALWPGRIGRELVVAAAAAALLGVGVRAAWVWLGHL